VNNAPLEGEGTVRTSTLETAVNPYKMKGRDVQSKGTGGNNQDESGHVDRNALPEVSNPTGADPSSTKSAHDSTTDVVSLPDLGLSPLAQLSELQHLDIDHSQYKPPSQKTCPDPIVHKLDAKNRPTHTRRSIAVDRVFSGPIKNLWKSKFASFNHVQSEMAHVLANSDDNVIVSAPTGAGKTALFEMAMARLFSGNSTGRHVRNDKLGKMVASVSKVRKVVYIAPNKALCEERQSDWSKRLVDIDPRIICTTITGDAKASSCYADIASAHLILTTPEKWDSITRRWNDQFVLLSSFKLVLIDEVHLIGEKERGGCLESVICRMKTIQRAACARKLTSSEIASSR
jgi:ATP-dependent DNA helicase HFM1/MER3